MEGETIPCERAGLTGSLFLEATNALSRAEREGAIYDAITAGSVPSFAQEFVDVRLAHAAHEAIVRVAVDYNGDGVTPHDVRFGTIPANRRPHLQPRSAASSCRQCARPPDYSRPRSSPSRSGSVCPVTSCSSPSRSASSRREVPREGHQGGGLERGSQDPRVRCEAHP